MNPWNSSLQNCSSKSTSSGFQSTDFVFKEGFLLDLRNCYFLILILMIWDLISILGSKLPFLTGCPSTASCSLQDWEHSLRSMTVTLEQDSEVVHHPDSSCGTFLAIAGLELGSRLPLSASMTDSLCQILPTKLYVVS